MDDVTWAALTLTLTAIGGLYTWFAFRRRGIAAGLRGASFTLLPLAAFLTDTLRMFTRIGEAVADWAVGLVLSPTVWAGIALAGLAVVLYVVSGFLIRRQLGTTAKTPDGTAGKKARKKEPAAAPEGRRAGELGASKPAEPALDDDLADIEALLRRRGIT